MLVQKVIPLSCSYADIDTCFTNVTTREQAFHAAIGAAKRIGFDYLIHAPVRNHPNASDNWAMTSYPTEWQRLYAEKKYLARNPVRNQTLVTDRLFLWSEVEKKLPPTDRELFHDCRSTGMNEGVVVPIHGPWGMSIATGFACQHKDATSNPTALNLLQLVALRLHQHFDPIPKPLETPLTRRERDVLQRVAEGLENREISDLLLIGEHSVEWHLKNIYNKLNVRNRTSAVVKAIQMSIISV